jgi:AhpD family alkylhydroperoxidase
MANSLATLEAYLQSTSALEDGSLDATFRELIALGTAEMNQCEYCLSAHSAIGKVIGLDDDKILAGRHAHAKDAKANAALHFSCLVVQKRGAVSDADIDAARKGGLTDGGHDLAIRLLKRKPKMGRFGLFAHFLGQFRE